MSVFDFVFLIIFGFADGDCRILFVVVDGCWTGEGVGEPLLLLNELVVVVDGVGVVITERGCEDENKLRDCVIRLFLNSIRLDWASSIDNFDSIKFVGRCCCWGRTDDGTVVFIKFFVSTIFVLANVSFSFEFIVFKFIGVAE